MVCLIGPSGCGKSTLLRCVNALETIQQGEIRLDGERVSGRGVDVNALPPDVGIVFQSFNLFPHMSVLDNVSLAPRKVLKLSKAEAIDRAHALLDRIGMSEKRDEYPDRLSGGQQQRVAIVRALAMQPRVMLLDEITSALDPELVAEVLTLVGELAREGMTMLIATHEMGFARDVASKVVFLYAGRIEEEGPPDQLFRDPHSERTRTLPAQHHRSEADVARRRLRRRSSPRARPAVAASRSARQSRRADAATEKSAIAGRRRRSCSGTTSRPQGARACCGTKSWSKVAPSVAGIAAVSRSIAGRPLVVIAPITGNAWPAPGPASARTRRPSASSRPRSSGDLGRSLPARSWRK